MDAVSYMFLLFKRWLEGIQIGVCPALPVTETTGRATFRHVAALLEKSQFFRGVICNLL